MNYQWYPGHMTKARRMMQEDIKLIDLVIELIDARIPFSSRNPDIDELGKNKQRLILLNKADLADERRTEAWAEYFRGKGFYVVNLDARARNGMKAVSAMITEACREKIERDRKRGIKNRPVRAMIVGIPNVGKSTFINTYAGKACAKTGNKPGVTRGKQWIRLNKDVELLDTPGILWPRFDDQMIGLRLAVTGAIRDEILQTEELALWLIGYLKEYYPGMLKQRYQIEESGVGAVKLPELEKKSAAVSEQSEPETRSDGLAQMEQESVPDASSEEALSGETRLLAEIARVRGCLGKGGQPDYEKAAQLLIDDFRSGRLGRISLEEPDGYGREKSHSREP